jgi:mRNA interferase MazF
LNRVLAVEVTTRVRMIPQELVLGRREGMPRSCVANFDNLHAVPVSMLVERIGGLAAARTVEVKHAVGWIELTSL